MKLCLRLHALECSVDKPHVVAKSRPVRVMQNMC